MANKLIFKSSRGPLMPSADTLNEAGGLAYRFGAKHALAQYAATGCLNGTFYADAHEQLTRIMSLACEVEPEFVAKVALYARTRARMKDMPALLLAVLSVRDGDLLERVFPRVIDNGRMLRTFVQIMRSGVVGRKSLGSRPRRLVREWLTSRSDGALFRASVGAEPSLADIVKMVHPRPGSDSRKALYAYFIGREHDEAALAAIVRQYEAFKRGESLDLPDVPHEMLTALPLGPSDWAQIARQCSWQTLRMNLNTFARHGVFADPLGEMSQFVAAKLRDVNEVLGSRVLPYQCLVALTNAGDGVPKIVRRALEDSLEIALRNVPAVHGRVRVLVDVSGSMTSPVTGFRKGATTAVRCIDAAALFAAVLLRSNPETEVVAFSDHARLAHLNARDTLVTNTEKLTRIVGGGTNCSTALALLNEQREMAELVVFISDNQSWMETTTVATGAAPTETMREWGRFKSRNAGAKLVCVDLQPYGTTQTAEREDILNVGGFSDRVFDVIGKFADGSLTTDHWIGVIEQERIEARPGGEG